MTMKAIGLDDEEADMLATRALATPPSITVSESLTVMSGAMGVGKTTELERVHRLAIDRALADPDAPIPVFLRASEVTQFLASGRGVSTCRWPRRPLTSRCAPHHRRLG